MRFRTKIALVTFLTAIIPGLLVVGISTYLLSTAIDRVANSGIEKSLISADSLIHETQWVVGGLIEYRLANAPKWRDQSSIDAWVANNNLDLAYRIGTTERLFAISDSLSFDVTVLSDSPVSKAGLSHVQLGDSDFLIYTHLDSQDIIGAGILLPDNYAERGRRLNESIAVVTSMQLFKTFSLKLLSITVAVAVILSLILSILISRLISRRMSRPLDLLLRGVQLIGQGELDYRVNVTGSDEFSNLGRSFNMMAGELKANQTKLLEAQRVAAWREVARRVAHEIKNPLTPIAIQLYRIEQELAGDENHPERMDAIISIKSQLAILQDLARHFAAFAKEPSLNTAPCHLNDIIHEAVLPYVSPSKLTIKVDIDPRLPRLNLDMQMMRLAFGNLIKNSIEASPEGAAICIQARPLGAEVEIIFRDNGPGFPSGKLSQIDQPYITSKPGGTGLGMIIVKKIIEEHGGSIAFSNDRGAVITIRLPIPSAGK